MNMKDENGKDVKFDEWKMEEIEENGCTEKDGLLMTQRSLLCCLRSRTKEGREELPNECDDRTMNKLFVRRVDLLDKYMPVNDKGEALVNHWSIGKEWNNEKVRYWQHKLKYGRLWVI